MSANAPHFRIATVPGDGIGTEITAAAVQVLRTLASTSTSSGQPAFSLEFTDFDWSSEKYAERGYYMPEGSLESMKGYDAILFGAVGWPSVPDHISLWNMILPIRKQLNQYVNVRPVHILPGITPPLATCQKDPSKLNWVIVRENSEGEYAGQGGTTHENSPFTTATELAIFTRPAITRIHRFAFHLAAQRPARHLTLVTKSNAQRHGMVLWDKIFYEVEAEPSIAALGIRTDKLLVDAAAARMVTHPESLDTIVATNLHADILTDLAAALAGGMGVAPSSNLDPTRTYPSMFEPIHGSAPDIAGKGIANPIGALWSAAEMVRWCAGRGEDAGPEGLPKGSGIAGMCTAADRLMRAVETVTRNGTRTPDLGGHNSTTEVTEAVCKELEKSRD